MAVRLAIHISCSAFLCAACTCGTARVVPQGACTWVSGRHVASCMRQALVMITFSILMYTPQGPAMLQNYIKRQEQYS